LLDGFQGRSIVPRHHDGKIEPLFAIYSGKLKPEHSLIDMIARMNPVYIDASKFSKYAFFNINTEVDYTTALEIEKNMGKSGEV
jgi:molybdopterin-guanine dinucleotide biosynthesis protein A